MPRYVKDMPIAMSPEQASALITGYMQAEGFKFVTEKTENVWRKGGAAAIPQFVKAEPAEGQVHIEAWVAGLSLVPGVYTGEQGLEGVWGFAIKSALKSRIAQLEYRLSDGVAPGATVPADQQTPSGWYPDPQGEHQSRWWNGARWTEDVADDGVQSTDPS